MAQLARFQDSFANESTGLPVVGAEVTLYREGATANGSSGPNSPTLAVAVHSPGRIQDGDAVFLDNDPSTTYSVDTVDATTVNLQGLGADLTVSNLQRLVPVTDPPTLYEDDQGGGSGSTPNPLTTDSVGRVNCWIETGAYEEIIDVSGTKTLFQGIQIGYDAPAVLYSSVFDGASAVAHILDTRNALTNAAAKLLELRNNNVLKFSIDKDGKIVGGLNILTGDIDLTVGDLNIPAGQIAMSAAASQLVPGATSFSIRDTGDANDNLLVEDDGDVIVRQDIDRRRTLATKGTALTDTGGSPPIYGDFTLEGNWGTSPSVTVVAGSTDTRGHVSVVAGTGSPGANPGILLTFKDGAFPSVPFVVCQRTSGNAPAEANFVCQAPLTTSVRFSFIGTPGASLAYALQWSVIG